MGGDSVTPVNVVPRPPRRPPDAHKGTFGKALVVGGSRGMSGAAVLCGRAALRAGAGLVQVACPAAVQAEVAVGDPCYTTFGLRQHTDGAFSEGVADELVELGRAANAVAVGPGIGRAEPTADLVRAVLAGLPRTPAVVDADGLNALAPFTAAYRDRPVPLVLTPHPGEFARLSGVPVPELHVRREAAAAGFAARFGVVVLLKGMGTVVTDGRRVFRNSTGNPGMATGGSGDVLTGVIVALLAGGLPPFEAAALGAWAHGRAGDLAAGDLGHAGLTAADLPAYLPRVFRDLEAR